MNTVNLYEQRFHENAAYFRDRFTCAILGMGRGMELKYFMEQHPAEALLEWHCLKGKIDKPGSRKVIEEAFRKIPRPNN